MNQLIKLFLTVIKMIKSGSNILLLVKIILPFIICLVPFIFFDIDIGYHVLIFSIGIIIFNYKKIKYDYTLSFIYSLGLCYFTFFISIGLYFGIAYILMQVIELDRLEDVFILGYNLKKLLLLLPIVIFSPVLMFFTYRFLFEIKKINYYKNVRFITIFILLILGILELTINSQNLFMYWQFIMILAIQLILYQKELNVIFNIKEKV